MFFGCQEKLAVDPLLLPINLLSRYHSTFVTATLSVPLTLTVTVPIVTLPAVGEVSLAAGAIVPMISRP